MGGFLGIGGKKSDSPPPPKPQPVVVPTEDPENKKRIGRSQLISSSARGVLGNANTSGKKLSV